jgi:hypothetical protein
MLFWQAVKFITESVHHKKKIRASSTKTQDQGKIRSHNPSFSVAQTMRSLNHQVTRITTNSGRVT